jgi:hypothetical protein
LFWRFQHLHLWNSGFYCPWNVLWAGVQECLFGGGCDLTEDDLCWRLFHGLMWALAMNTNLSSLPLIEETQHNGGGVIFR